jgi:GT2 family glycosyltransferase
MSLFSFIAGIPQRIAMRMQKNTPRVLAVIPTGLTDEKMLLRCLESLKHASEGIELRIILVLCPTTKEKTFSLQAIAQGRAECISLDGPFSFARSNNAALEFLKDEKYVLFLNDDCFFRGSYDIKFLIHSLAKRNLVAIGPWFNHHFHKKELPREFRSFGVKTTRFPILGACIIFSRAWLDRIGHYDESFDGYGMEEADLLFRALEENGRWMRDDRIVVDHIHHATFGSSIKDEEPHLRNLKRWSDKYPGIDSWGKTPEWKRNLRRR